MPTFDVGAYLAATDITLDGITSTKFPEGKAYRFESPSAARGFWMREMVQLGITAQLTGKNDPRLTALNDLDEDEDEELDLYRDVLGSDTLDELIADGVPWVAVQRIFGLLLRRYTTDRDISTELAAAAASAAPEAATKAPARKRTARKAPAKKVASKATAGAS